MLAIQRKDKNQKGFTLAELLVVVAIIAVLVAVSIPIFTAKLEKSREATDIANMRAAKAAATVALLSEESFATNTDVWTSSGTAGDYTAYYDADNGKLVKNAPAAYGKGTSKPASTTYTGYDATKDYTASTIKVTCNAKTDTVTVAWDPAGK